MRGRNWLIGAVLATSLLSGCGSGYSTSDFRGAVHYCTDLDLPNCVQRVTIFEETGCELEAVYEYIDRIVRVDGIDAMTLGEEREWAKWVCLRIDNSSG